MCFCKKVNKMYAEKGVKYIKNVQKQNAKIVSIPYVTKETVYKKDR